MSAAKPNPTLKRMVSTAVQDTMQRWLLRGPAEELRTLRATIGRLERRLERISMQIGRRPRGPGGGKPGRPPLHEVCTVAGCRASHYALGLCSKHYQRRRRVRATGLRRRA